MILLANDFVNKKTAIGILLISQFDKSKTVHSSAHILAIFAAMPRPNVEGSKVGVVDMFSGALGGGGGQGGGGGPEAIIISKN